MGGNRGILRKARMCPQGEGCPGAGIPWAPQAPSGRGRSGRREGVLDGMRFLRGRGVLAAVWFVSQGNIFKFFRILYAFWKKKTFQ